MSIEIPGRTDRQPDNGRYRAGAALHTGQVYRSDAHHSGHRYVHAGVCGGGGECSINC